MGQRDSTGFGRCEETTFGEDAVACVLMVLILWMLTPMPVHLCWYRTQDAHLLYDM